MPVDSYVIRVYRRGAGKAPVLVGVVEEVGVAGTRPFGDAEGLWRILASPKRRKARAPLATKPRKQGGAR